MNGQTRYKRPEVHGASGEAIAESIRKVRELAGGWTPAAALRLLTSIELARESGESIRGVLRAAQVSYRTYWMFARGLTLGAVPYPWMPLRALALAAGVQIVPLAAPPEQIFEAVDGKKRKIYRARVGHYLNVDVVRWQDLRVVFESAGIATASDGCPLMRGNDGRMLRAPIGSDRFSKVLAASSSQLREGK